MAQKTNLNISPYFDDFNSEKNFYKVLFRPGIPVQTRELNNLQSILQNQIESFGSHIFKEGSVVIPGNITYDPQFYAIKLNPVNFGVNISLYINQYIGKKIIGRNSGITASVKKVVIPDANNGLDYITLYVKYIDSNNNFIISQFEDNEELVCNESVSYGNNVISAGSPFARLITLNSTFTGSAASISSGIFFVRGSFVSISDETIILDYYTNSPSYRVGLKVSEEIITARDDNTLYDNAKGFTNYSAPGADRFKILLTLTKKTIDSYETDTDFIELLRIEEGQIKKINTKSDYSIIRDYLAQRTYDESGNYSVNQFAVSLHNSLNDRLGNDGLYFSNQKTNSNNTPSDDLMCVKISPGKAYVKGYDIEKTETTIIDVEKPRQTETVLNNAVSFDMGNLIRVNNVSGAPKQNYAVELHSVRRSSSGTPISDTKVGDARVYNFRLTDSAYTADSTNWDLYLYDIQSYTKLTLNQSASSTDIPASSYIKGKSSGSSGYTVEPAAGSTIIKVRQTSGNFIKGEQIIVNGVESISRSISDVVVYNVDDIKQIYQSTTQSGLSTAFMCDTVLDRQIPRGFLPSDTININSGNVVTCPGRFFSNIKPGSIIRYQPSAGSLEKYNRVVEINTLGSSMVVEAVNSVTGVCDGTVGVTTNASFALGVPRIRNSNRGFLYAEIPNSNVSFVDLNDSVLSFSYQTNVQKSSNSPITISLADFSFPIGLNTCQFQNFDEERYSIHYTDGTTEPLTSDKFSLVNNQVTFSNLTSGKTTLAINATFIKNNVQSKKKQKVKSKSINVIYSKNKQSGSGLSTSINDGLVYNQYYGLRVQDEEICLNYPDVIKVLAVYESLDTSNPTVDTLYFNTFSNIQTNAIVGENIIGSDSSCIARIVSKGVDSVGVVYLNSNRFIENELVTFDTSNISNNITSIVYGKFNDITNRFTLDKGQKEQYYDYSKLVRNSGEASPSKRLLVVFDYYEVPVSDTGDVHTVLSYDDSDYVDLPTVGINNRRVSDILDFRPRVDVFNTFTSSPFDFYSKNLSSIRLNLTPNESAFIGYEYYLPRIDKIYLDKSGNFNYQAGVTSSNFNSEIKSSDLMEIATINLPPYLYNVNNAILTYVDNRRYTMRDIGSIENRVRNLERVTSLSLLELNTQTLQIQDSEGFNRFKTGFFVDDFKDNSRLNNKISTVEIDSNNQELTPIISRNSLKNYLSPFPAVIDEEADLSSNYNLIDSNIQKTGQAITLKYSQKRWISQPFATRVENVNPFNVVTFNGTIKLSPNRDNWVRTVQLPDKSISVTDHVLIERSPNIVEERIVRRAILFQLININPEDTTVSQNVTETTATTNSSSSVRNLIETRPEEFMRSRNTEFSVTNLKPLTQYYQFLDGNGSVDFVPKLVEIATDSSLQNYGSQGSFIVGETVNAWITSPSGLYIPIIQFRVATPNHKYGPYNNPTVKFDINPYDKNESLPDLYSPSSKVLNIDTFSLSEEAQGLYSGYLIQGVRLIGATSGAIAYVKNLRLISDNYGDLIGTFFIRDPNTTPPPSVRINTGNKTYKISSSPSNERSIVGSTSISSAETTYNSSGTVELYETTITNRSVVTTTRTTNIVLTRVTTEFFDPLAQSFTVGGSGTTNDDENGVYLTSVDLFFAKKDSNNSPVTVEIRTMELGTPTRVRIGNSVTLRPQQINTSTDGSVATNVVFDYPIFLEPGLEYCVVLLAPESNDYEVFIAQMGEKTIQSQNLPDSQSVSYTQQFALGSLFKSQNGSIWTANQYQDLKFVLYKAEFVSNTPSTAYFYNPTLNKSNGYVKKLLNNPITILPRKISIGINTITNSNLVGILTVGRKVGESAKTYNYGYISRTGSAASSVAITTEGTNYTTTTNTSTFNFTGNGSGLKLNITATSGKITNISIASSGNGYSVGDVVGIVTSSVNNNSGNGAKITVTGNNNSIDTLHLSNVQGNQFTSDGTANLVYYDNSNNAVSLANTFITNSVQNQEVYSGNYFRVDHFNHGMYAKNNKVEISGVLSNIPPTTLTQSIQNNSIAISVASTSNFNLFEGVVVGNTNPGYILIENEIIKYESVGNGTLGTLTRGQNSTIPISHGTNSKVYKYELDGVSLNRINTTHDVSDLNLNIDEYYLEFNRSSNGPNRSNDASLANSPQLSFNSELTCGGAEVFASENIQYDTIIPFYNLILPSSSVTVDAKIKTTSGTSISGNEVSFNDLGYENIQLNTTNKLNSTRIVCSNVNENTYLNGNKSFTTALTFTTRDKNLSPQIFLDNSFTDFHSYRINRPISDYPSDNRVNSIINDPHAAIYVSNTVLLSQAATSLKVILSAYRSSSSDFRVLYSLIRPNSSEVDSSFELFPGYDNLTVNNNNGFVDVIDPAKNSGLPDRFVRPSKDNEFLEYEFTSNNLDQFTGYIIKIVMTATDQSKAPRFKDLRTIAIR